MIYEFTVPGNPVAKARHRTTVRNGKVRSYTPAKTVAHERTIGWYAKQAIASPLSGPLRLEVVTYHKLPRKPTAVVTAMLLGVIRPTTKPDATNLAKAVEDGMNKIAYHDDCQVVEIEHRKFYSTEPRTVVRLLMLGD